jgi:hypothetical protein
MKKRAVSEVIVMIIIVLITIVSINIAYLFIKYQIEKDNLKSVARFEETSFEIDSVSLRLISSSYNTSALVFRLKNEKDVDIIDFKLNVYGERESWEGKLSEFADPLLKAFDTREIILPFNYAIFGDLERIEIYPIFQLNNKNISSQINSIKTTSIKKEVPSEEEIILLGMDYDVLNTRYALINISIIGDLIQPSRLKIFGGKGENPNKLIKVAENVDNNTDILFYWNITPVLDLEDSLFYCSFNEGYECQAAGNGIPLEIVNVGEGIFIDKAIASHDISYIKYSSADNIGLEGTIEFWFSPNWNGWSSQSRTIFFTGENSNNNLIKIIFNGNTKSIEFHIIDKNGKDNSLGFKIDGSALNWKAGEWHKISAVWDINNVEPENKDKMFLYADGYLKGINMSNSISIDAGSGEFYIAGGLEGSSASASFDEFIIYNSIRTPVQILDGYRLGNGEYLWKTEIKDGLGNTYYSGIYDFDISIIPPSNRLPGDYPITQNYLGFNIWNKMVSLAIAKYDTYTISLQSIDAFPSSVSYLRDLNPYMKIIPHISVGIARDFKNTDYQTFYYFNNVFERLIADDQKEEWYLHRPDGSKRIAWLHPQSGYVTYSTNPSDFSSWKDYITKFTKYNLIDTGLVDGHFADILDTSVFSYQSGEALDINYNGVDDSSEAINSLLLYSNGMVNFASIMRSLYGDKAFIVGNKGRGYSSNSVFWPYINTGFFESAFYSLDKWEGFQSGIWPKYISTVNLGYKPSSGFIGYEFINSNPDYIPNVASTGDNYITMNSAEAKKLRFALAMTLMMNGSFGFKCSDSNEQSLCPNYAYWIKELDYNLGKPVSEYKVNLNNPNVLFREFERGYVVFNGDASQSFPADFNFIENSKFLDTTTGATGKIFILGALDGRIYINCNHVENLELPECD